MDKILQIILIIVTVLFSAFIVRNTSRKKLNYKLTILWLMFSIFIITLAVFPQIVMWMSEKMHIETPVNALFLMFIFLLIIIAFYISAELSKLQNKVTILIQEIALLNKKIEKNIEKNDIKE